VFSASAERVVGTVCTGIPSVVQVQLHTVFSNYQSIKPSAVVHLLML